MVNQFKSQLHIAIQELQKSSKSKATEIHLKLIYIRPKSHSWLSVILGTTIVNRQIYKAGYSHPVKQLINIGHTLSKQLF